MSGRRDKGQAILLVVVALGIFLIGALGLAIDTGQLYGHRQMAQASADAASQAAILSILNGTNTGGNTFATTTGYSHDCTTAEATTLTPCIEAQRNGFFGAANGDTVHIDVPTPDSIGMDPATLSGTDPVNLIRVTVTRPVSGGIIRMLGAAATTNIKAVSVAAIVAVQSPVPLLITHPTYANALQTVGGSQIAICGGPTKSIQVNSTSDTAVNVSGVDLSLAGPNDPGNCTTGTGADFGVTGGPYTQPTGVNVGTTGEYVSRASIIDDPLAPLLTTPTVPATHAATFTTHATDSPNYGCVYAACTVYSPGLYDGGINVSTGNPDPLIFQPGFYYMRGGGFILKNVYGGRGPAASHSAMCSGCASDPDTGTGMVIYDAPPTGSSTTGGFDIDARKTLSGNPVGLSLDGATTTTLNAKGETVPAPPYYNLLLWEYSGANAHTGSNPTAAGGQHSLGQGNGCLTLTGTIYATNPRSTMLADPTHYQAVSYNGSPCSTTVQQGNIIVGTLQINGGVVLKMKLIPYSFLKLRQVALVH